MTYFIQNLILLATHDSLLSIQFLFPNSFSSASGYFTISRIYRWDSHRLYLVVHLPRVTVAGLALRLHVVEPQLGCRLVNVVPDYRQLRSLTVWQRHLVHLPHKLNKLLSYLAISIYYILSYKARSHWLTLNYVYCLMSDPTQRSHTWMNPLDLKSFQINCQIFVLN